MAAGNSERLEDVGGWIDFAAVPSLHGGQRIIIFGAGYGAAEYLRYLRGLADSPNILCIVDNDASKWGGELYGVTVEPPSVLPELSPDMIVVTTVSGRGPVAKQLTHMGYAEKRDFVCVGSFPPAHHEESARMILEYNHRFGLITPGGAAVNVGPGGMLAVEQVLYGLGFDQVDAVEAFDFNLLYPEWRPMVVGDKTFAQVVIPIMEEYGVDIAVLKERAARFLQRKNGRLEYDQSKILLHRPYRFSKLPLPDAGHDLITSFAVLEHVVHPQAAVTECFRVLKPGGKALHHIVTRDHRCFDPFVDFSPIACRFCSQQEWDAAASKRFYQNRVAPHQWLDMFAKAGFAIDHFETMDRVEITPEVWAKLAPEFASWTDEELSALDCVIVAHKG